MSPFRPAGKAVFRIKVPNRHGGWVDRSTGTRHEQTAAAMQRMVDELGKQGSRDWEWLEAVYYRRVSLGVLYDAWRAHDLTGLRERLRDVDLRSFFDRWQAWLRPRVTRGTAARYLTHLTALAGEQDPWWRSSFTSEALERAIGQLQGSAGTVRKYFAAAQSFAGYLLSIGVLADSPLTRLKAPPAPAPHPEFLELEQVLRLVEAAPDVPRALFAFLYGSGCDLSTALALCRRDVTLADRTVRARGTKSYNRDRVVFVTEWAWKYVEARCRALLPDAPLFPGLSRWTASDIHHRLLERLKIARPGITLHAARNHWAVRMLKNGATVELVARQLGHKDGTLVLKVYGRYLPDLAERQRLDRAISRREKAR